MGLGMGLYLQQKQEIYLDQKQSLVLKQLLKIKPTHEGIPNAAQGIEGLRSADSLLKQRNIRGILIGGLAEAAWNPKYTKEKSFNHKDIDILIPSMSEESSVGRLERGIDWWLPIDDRLKINYITGPAELNAKYWVNAFDIRLSFGVEEGFTETLAPGLYIPDPEFVIEMRRAEAFAKIETRGIEIDSDVEQKFIEKLRKEITNEMSPIITKEFGDQITSNFTIKPFDHETVLAINES